MNPSTAAERYRVTELPFIPFSDTGGEALNDKGVVAGGIAGPDGTVSLAVWFNDVLTNLGVPPGVPGPEFNRPRIFGMNDCGAVVSTVHTSAGDLPSRSFVLDRGRYIVLPLLDPANLGGAAIGINNRGEVVGYDHTSKNRIMGWRWCDGSYFRLPITGSNTAAFGINSGGTIIGNRRDLLIRRLLTGQWRSARESGYVLANGTARYLNGFVNAINDLGEAAGGSAVGGRRMATLFKDGIATVMLRLPSAAIGINSAASVVGFFQPAGSGRRHIFRWSANAGAFDLTPDGYRSAEAAAINDRGDILGYGERVSGKSGYFLLTPDPTGGLAPRALTAASSGCVQ